MTKKTIMGFGFGRFIFMAASIPALILCGLLTRQPWYEALLSVYSVVALMVLAEGRRAGCAFGMVYCLAYGALFLTRGIYGLAAFNAFFGAPVYLMSFISWGKHKQDKTVAMKRLTPKLWALSVGLSIVGFAGIYLLLRSLGSQGALWDSMSLSLVAPGLILLLLRYVENWIFNLAGNFVVLILWVANTLEDAANFNFVLIAALAVTVNAIGFVTWLKLERKNKP